MSFDKGPKMEAAPTIPNPADQTGRPLSERRRRMASGGTRSTFMGSAAMAALPAAGPTLTGLSS